MASSAVFKLACLVLLCTVKASVSSDQVVRYLTPCVSYVANGGTVPMCPPNAALGSRPSAAWLKLQWTARAFAGAYKTYTTILGMNNRGIKIAIFINSIFSSMFSIVAKVLMMGAMTISTACTMQHFIACTAQVRPPEH
ncbi:hypothetical protein CJ030_MR2G028490 [Morella rubra]|uniref:Uncharacterized protein n=1 Tax=Morella rubra TaxID=262757 RepID=A0A6A1WH65_9ROSI|nr:hypothetical protein CJ030_MR2G028490 [Morella rubra]